MNRQSDPGELIDDTSGGGLTGLNVVPQSLLPEGSSPRGNNAARETIDQPPAAAGHAFPPFIMIDNTGVGSVFREVFDAPVPGQVVYEIDGRDDIVTTRDETAEEVAEDRQAMVDHGQEPTREPRAPLQLPDWRNLEPIEEAIQTLTPPHQILVRDFFHSLHNAVAALVNDPERPPLANQESLRHLNLPDIDDAMEALDMPNRQRVNDFVTELLDGMLELNNSPDRARQSAQHVSNLLDRLTNAPLVSSVEAELVGDDSSKCSICLVNYIGFAGDSRVILPCHPSHHFHRTCIENWFSHHLNCPLCRTSMALAREESAAT
ncbi:hypothetical protein PCANC_09248 [Puccinia coronata f. sp. avenae]|uniref:RING-type domain-containing protein n=1 Tax=Puccinia coronata f. sp. avenae TaxID=200324 RepID=A0A2N5T2Y8_9BASI|nr:hypothetical protein PCANC_09248 [Puccinia coronata f. sp. avenae]